MANPDVCVVSIEVDGRQKYLFEADKLQEMLGASRIMAQSVKVAERLFAEKDGLFLFHPVSGEIRAWAKLANRSKLLHCAWELRRWFAEHGVEHTAVYFETSSAHFMQSRSAGVAPDGNQDAWIEPDKPSLSWVQRALSVRMTARKSAKIVEDSRPGCSLFAPCLIHPAEAATRWATPTEDEPRRGLCGERAWKKYEVWKNCKESDFFAKMLIQPFRSRFNSLHVDPPNLERAHLFEDLTNKDAADQFIAFICADGDGMGQLLSKIDWNAAEWEDGNKEPWRRNAEFARQLNDCFQGAFRHAAASVLLPDADAAKKWRQQFEKDHKVKLPALPQLLGGDDLWMVVNKTIAADLAGEFSAIFRRILDGSAVYGGGPQVPADVVRRALKLAGVALSISLGIAFAKKGYPVWAMIEAAESLMNNAKLLRKQKIWGRRQETSVQHGCVDWHWIESSVTETIGEARRNAWTYHDGYEKATLILTTRPWKAESIPHFIRATNHFRQVARRKRVQLDQILRLGYTLSLLAWEGWWKRLSSEDRKHISDAKAELQSAGWEHPAPSAPWGFEFSPWCQLSEPPVTGLPSPETGAPSPPYGVSGDVYATPWLDLLALDDILRRGDQEEHLTIRGDSRDGASKGVTA